jgi:hypothetical protein
MQQRKQVQFGVQSEHCSGQPFAVRCAIQAVLYYNNTIPDCLLVTVVILPAPVEIRIATVIIILLPLPGTIVWGKRTHRRLRRIAIDSSAVAFW